MDWYAYTFVPEGTAKLLPKLKGEWLQLWYTDFAWPFIVIINFYTFYNEHKWI